MQELYNSYIYYLYSSYIVAIQKLYSSYIVAIQQLYSSYIIVMQSLYSSYMVAIQELYSSYIVAIQQLYSSQQKQHKHQRAKLIVVNAFSVYVVFCSWSNAFLMIQNSPENKCRGSVYRTPYNVEAASRNTLYCRGRFTECLVSSRQFRGMPCFIEAIKCLY